MEIQSEAQSTSSRHLISAIYSSLSRFTEEDMRRLPRDTVNLLYKMYMESRSFARFVIVLSL